MGGGVGGEARAGLQSKERRKAGEKEGTRRLFLENQSLYKNGQKGERTRIIYLLALF